MSSSEQSRKPEPRGSSPNDPSTPSKAGYSLPKLARGIRYKPFKVQLAESLDGKPLDPTKRPSPGT